MNKKILIALLSVATLTAAKCNDGEIQDIAYDSPKCGPVTKATISYFGYGDGKMLIVPITNVERGGVVVIGLDPRDNFKDATVTVTSTEATWIGGSGTYKTALRMPELKRVRFIEVGCVPENEDVGEEYKYMIEVVDTASGVKNILDPRMKVER
jgi:hypothetical protein